MKKKISTVKTDNPESLKPSILMDAELVIVRGVVTKNRFGPTGRFATAKELADAVRV